MQGQNFQVNAMFHSSSIVRTLLSAVYREPSRFVSVSNHGASIKPRQTMRCIHFPSHSSCVQFNLTLGKAILPNELGMIMTGINLANVYIARLETRAWILPRTCHGICINDCSKNTGYTEAFVQRETCASVLQVFPGENRFRVIPDFQLKPWCNDKKRPSNKRKQSRTAVYTRFSTRLTIANREISFSRSNGE